MSGGHFNYQQFAMSDIANVIERDIAKALKPKPEMEHRDYWVIEEQNTPHSYGHYSWGFLTFPTYDEAESFLLSRRKVVKAEQIYKDKCLFKEGVIFQSTDSYMTDTSDEEQIPALYSIRHCEYDHYPYEADVLDLTEETIETMKEAYRQIRIAEIYATRVDRMMSGDDGEDTLRERLKEDLEAFDKEFKAKDWGCSFDEDY